MRIIVYYQADAERVDDIIRTNFEVDQLNTYRRSDTLADEQFGYLSNHYVVAMDEPRRSLPEWSLYTRMKAEIQVRTALQHAWAAVDHKMNYKATADIPSPVRRKMAMLSAIFELADEQFGLLREQRLQVREDYSTAVREASMDLPLDDTSISLLLEDKEVIEIIGEALRDASKQTWFSLHGNHVPEAINTEENSAKGRSELLTLLRNVNIRSLSQLQVLLTSDRAKSIMIIRSLNVQMNMANIVAIDVSHVVATWLLVLLNLDPADVDYSDYDKYREAVATVRAEVHG